MNRNYAHFWDMYQACLRIDEFTRNLTWENYRENQLVQSAVERQFEILGEAARRISSDYQDAHPRIPWKDLIGQCNIIAHQYEKVNPKCIWSTIQKSLPALAENLKNIIPNLD